jgi:hypothetical protein
MRIALASAAVVALVQAAPVVIAGHGYAPHAHVTVVYRSGSTTARQSVTASAAGAFRVTFAKLRFKRCSGLSLAAGTTVLDVASCAGAVTGRAFVPGERVSVVAQETGVAAVSSAVTAGGQRHVQGAAGAA